VVHKHGGRARCVPGRSVDAGNSRSLADVVTCPLTGTRAGLRMAAYVLLSKGSWISFMTPPMRTAGTAMARHTGAAPGSLGGRSAVFPRV